MAQNRSNAARGIVNFTEEDRVRHLKTLLDDPSWDIHRENILGVIRWYEEGNKLSHISHWFVKGQLCAEEPEELYGKAFIWEERICDQISPTYDMVSLDPRLPSFTEEDRIRDLKKLLEEPFWTFQRENILGVICWYEEGNKLSYKPRRFVNGKVCDQRPEFGKYIIWEETVHNQMGQQLYDATADSRVLDDTAESRIEDLKELLDDLKWEFQRENILAVIRWYEQGNEQSYEPHWFVNGKEVDQEPDDGKDIVWEEARDDR